MSELLALVDLKRRGYLFNEGLQCWVKHRPARRRSVFVHEQRMMDGSYLFRVEFRQDGEFKGALGGVVDVADVHKAAMGWLGGRRIRGGKRR